MLTNQTRGTGGVLIAIAFALMGLLAAPQAEASNDCTVSTPGSTCNGGSCTVNTDNCNGGDCRVNSGACTRDGTCLVNDGTCRGGTCFVNFGTCQD
ncbi:MAG TPA: hypothetical protein VHI93_07785 [Candidatus Thermoplasmatota archaeon]|nr:hypothetical protein [Candidatus Thermoplasmatota archaeon]